VALWHLGAHVRDAISATGVANYTLILGSTILQTDAIPAMVVGITTANPVASADLYSVVSPVCGAIDPLQLDATDVEVWNVAAVAMKSIQGAIPVTGDVLDAKVKS
jgi:hypothetical protein